MAIDEMKMCLPRTGGEYADACRYTLLAPGAQRDHYTLSCTSAS